MKKIKVASFFSGIGGFDLGFEQAGFQVVFQCEIHRFCQTVLKHHWPGVVFTEDISKVKSNSIPEAEVWCGGFPCQDLSVARGSLGRHGLNGSRSGLFFRLADLAQKKKPRVIVIENVHGLLNSNNGKDFAELLHILGSLNYAVSWRLLNSRYFGVPQSRPRIYICAWLNDPVSAGSALFENQTPIQPRYKRSAFLETSWISGEGPIVPKVAFCLAATSGRHTGTDWSRTYVAYSDAVRRMTPLECERLQGFPDGWTTIDSAKLDVERADSLRYHSLGNAVSVPVIKWIAARIHSQLQVRRKGFQKSLKLHEFHLQALKLWPDLLDPSKISGDLATIRKSTTKIVWPHAGVLWRGIFVGNRAHPSPAKSVASDLLKLIENTKPEERYFLSPNAAEGILRRCDAQGRSLFPYLRSALERLSGRTSSDFNPIRPNHQTELLLDEQLCVLH